MLLAVKDVLVALLALFGAIADGVCLSLSVSDALVMSRESKVFRQSYHEIIAVLESDSTVEVGEEDELGVLERETESREIAVGSHCERYEIWKS